MSRVRLYARENDLTWLLLFVCSLGVAAPLFWLGPSCGHDFDFHLLSWMETAHDWHLGLVDPHWLTSANYGAGEPRFLFYPPASWMIGALLGGVGSALLGSQEAWTLAPILFTFLCVFSAGVCVFVLARMTASRVASTAAACLFVFNPYLLFVAYERTAYGELLATPLMALLLLCSLRPRSPVLSLALLVAALWLTNAPAAVMGCYTLALVCCVRLFAERHWLNAGKAIFAVVLGLALAGCYVVPAVWEQRWVQIGRAVSTGMRIEDSFLFRNTGQAYHDQVLHTASVIVVILFAIAAASWMVMLVRNTSRQRQSVRIFAALLAVILFLQFPASRWFWHVAPHLEYLQFPWRWLLVASIVTACLVASAISQFQIFEARSRSYLYVAVLIISGISTWESARNFIQSCDEQDRVSGQLDVFHSGAGVEGTDEYTATSADNSAIFQDLPAVRLLSNPDAEEPKENAGDNPEWDTSQVDPADSEKGEVRINSWQPEKRQIDVAADRPAFVVLRLMDYPAWDVVLNGHRVVGRLQREDGLMVVAVPAGSSHILVRWRTTPDVVLGRELSCGAFLIVVVLGRRRRTREAPSLTM